MLFLSGSRLCGLSFLIKNLSFLLTHDRKSISLFSTRRGTTRPLKTALRGWPQKSGRAATECESRGVNLKLSPSTHAGEMAILELEVGNEQANDIETCRFPLQLHGCQYCRKRIWRQTVGSGCRCSFLLGSHSPLPLSWR